MLARDANLIELTEISVLLVVLGGWPPLVPAAGAASLVSHSIRCKCASTRVHVVFQKRAIRYACPHRELHRVDGDQRAP